MILSREHVDDNPDSLLVTVTANFTAEPLGDSLQFWLSRTGFTSPRIYFSEYNQVFQELIAPASLPSSDRPGVNLLLIRIEDWGRDQPDDLQADTIAAIARDFIDTLGHFTVRARRSTVLLLCPPSQKTSADPKLTSLLKSLEKEMLDVLTKLRGLTVVGADEVAALYPVAEVDDPEGDRLGHVPFTPSYWTALGTMLVRRMRTIFQTPAKVIAVDADNTLWDGVVGEIGADQIRITPYRRLLQEFLHARKREGMLLVLASKNREEDLTEVFQRPDMVLHREDFAGWKVNWNPKSENLRELAKDLGLGESGFIFVDDNPLECAEVAAHCPEVAILPLPAAPADIPFFLDHAWVFDLPPATSADLDRTGQYRQQAQRRQLLASGVSFREFIDKLDLQVELLPPAPGQFPRLAQLTQRTNQFNATGIRRTTAEMAALLDSGERRAILAKVRDRFGDYGEVGAAVYSHANGEIHVDNFLLSCRALGKGVEHRMLAGLGDAAAAMNASHVVIDFQPTDRNEPAKRFFHAVGETYRDGTCYRFPTAAARSVTFNPDQTETADKAVEQNTTAPTELSAPRIDFATIARSLARVADIQLAIRRGRLHRRPALRHPFVEPGNATEARLALMWEEVLGVAPVGSGDGFIELGGQSIQAVQLASRVSAEFGVKVPLSVLFNYPRLSDLAIHIAGLESGGPEETIPKAATLTLSPAQERLWFLDQFIPKRSAYNIVAARRLRGKFDLPAWRKALQQVTHRHEALRTTVRQDGGTRIAIVAGPSSPVLRTIPASSENEALRLLREEAETPFDLSRAPLVRCLVVSLNPDTHFLLLNVHHIAADGWSINILLRELTEAYGAALRNRELKWRPPACTYSDYAAWLQNALTAGSFQADLIYWSVKLKSAPKLLELPADRPRPSVMTYEGAVAPGEITPDTRAAIEKLAVAEGTTPFVVMLAALQTVLHRYSGQADILIGTPVSGRNHPAIEQSAGCFINTVVIRNDVGAETIFRDHLQSVRQSVLEALVHGELPFERLVDDLKLERNLSHSPLFQVMLVLQNTPAGEFHGDGLEVEPVHVHNGGAKFDLVVEVVPNRRGYQLIVEYNSALFFPETVGRMVSHFTTLITAAVREPQMALGRLPLMESDELEAVLNRINTPLEEPYRGQLPLDGEGTLAQLFESQAARRPGAVALVCEDRSMSYAQLNAQANRVARQLVACGVKPDTLVGLCLERTNELVVALLAILKAGGAYLPIDLAYPAERLAFMLDDARAPVLLTQTKLLGTLPATQARILCVDEILARPGPVEEESNLPPQSGPDDPAYVIYTSGTTGKPKGSLITQRNVVRLFPATEHWYGFGEHDVWTLFHSSAFDFSVWEIWGALLYGGRLVVVPFLVSRSPEAFYELLVKEQVTVLNQTPSAFRQLIQAEESLGQKPLALRYVIFGGEALEMQSLRPWFERHGDRQPKLVNMYGITETTVHVTYRPLSKTDLESGSVIGVPIPDLRIFILDSLLQPVPIGVPGEMYVGGAGLARGYLHRPDLSAERFVPDHLGGRPGERLYKTGDLARFLPNRDIEYLGRIDHQVKIRGFRIELGEIESVLSQHPSVREALVLARQGAGEGKRLVGYLVADTALPVTDLREYLRRKLPDYMVPAAFVFLEKLPLTTNGKIDRAALPEPEQDRPDLAAAYVAPRNETETKLAAIWSRVLRIERVGVHDNFFEIGGDSILSIQIISLARQAGLALSPKLLFQHQTVAGLASVAAPAAEPAKAQQDLVSGSAPLTPIQHWFFEQGMAEDHYYNQTFLFTAKEPLDAGALARALAGLEQQHDALRLRFPLSGGDKTQVFSPDATATPLQTADLSSVPDGNLADAIEAACIHAQASLDHRQGPLWRAVYFDCGPVRPGRLLLAIHHLAVDGVSWRILMEDLERAYRAENSGTVVKLPAKTTSAKEWAERLAALAQQNRDPDDRAHWHALANDAGRLPIEMANGENNEASARSVTVRLSESETEALLVRAPAAYNTRINDLLLTAAVQALTPWTAAESVDLCLEGHGREDLFESLDLSRTVGWFTSIHPVRLRRSSNEAGELIKSVKEQLRSIPGRGIGYGVRRYLQSDPVLANANEPGILFNYLGQFDQVVADSQLFAFADEPVGPWHSPANRRRYLFEINSVVRAGCFELTWTYSENRHRRETVQRLANEFIAHLRHVIHHCAAPGARGATPSDFPHAALEQNDLDGLLSRIGDLEDVYALSPIQTLFYSAAAFDPLAVLDHWHGTLTGKLEVEKFKHAWRIVFERHSILRTTFQVTGREQPVQVVHRLAQLPWHDEDWRGLQAEDQRSRWSDYLQADRQRSLALNEPPLSRFALIRLADDRFKFLWSLPALLLDGWSWPLVFRDLSVVYSSLGRQSPAPLGKPGRYRDYVAWINGRNHSDAERFWRAALQGFAEPTPLVAESGSARSGASRSQWETTIDRSVTKQLLTLARQLQITPGALIQAAWAMVLARLSGRRDVVFGAAFAGRPAELEGAGEIVGPFVNNVPIRTKLNGAAPARAFLREFHSHLLELSPHQFTPLEQIQSWTEVPWRNRLFDSLVVVQNYLVDDTARHLGDSVGISDFAGPIHSGFPLLVLVEPEEQWRATFIYTRELPAATVERWGTDFSALLHALPAAPDLPVDSLLGRLSTPEKAPAGKKTWRVRSQDYLAPQSEAEGRIARVWEETLQLEKISIDENIFELGVHSLLAVRVHHRLCAELGRNFPLVTMFQFPTIQSLAGNLTQMPDGNPGVAIRDRAARQRRALTQLRSAGPRRPTKSKDQS